MNSEEEEVGSELLAVEAINNSLHTFEDICRTFSEKLVVEAVNNSLEKFEDICRTFLSYDDGSMTVTRVQLFGDYAQKVYERYPDINKPVWDFFLKHVRDYVKHTSHQNDLDYDMAHELTFMKAIIDTYGLLHQK